MEHKPLFAYGIFKVIYAPHKAFKEIIQNPRYHGPILIMILFAAAYAGSAYIVLSKTYNEQTLPLASQKDEWTENSTLWASIWTSNANITESEDCISGDYYGNKSIEFSVDDMQIWMQLNYTEPINCSGLEGYKNMSFRIKLIYPNTTELKNASLYLYSGPAYRFYYNLTKHFVSLNNSIWNNLTIPIGSESKCWVNSADDTYWGNITSLRFEFTWPETTNLTVRLDGLFFRGVFKSFMENAASYMFNFSAVAFMQFIIKWVFLSGILYVLAKAFGAETVWRPLLILVGFALITLFVQAVINAATYSTLPTLYYPLELIGGVKGESEIAYNKILEETWLVSQISNYVQIGVYVWTILLCAIAIRLLSEFTWTKCFLVSTVAYFLSMLAESFILGYKI